VAVVNVLNERWIAAFINAISWRVVSEWDVISARKRSAVLNGIAATTRAAVRGPALIAAAGDLDEDQHALWADIAVTQHRDFVSS
jgi:hypothetical protein